MTGGASLDRTYAIIAVPLFVAALWYVIAPLVVALGSPRIRQRNPDHFARLVRFSRLWGLFAVCVGVAVAYVR